MAKRMPTTIRAALLLALISIASIGTFGEEDLCVYTVYVRTGSIIKGGTDSNISVQFFDSINNSVILTNLTEWGGLLGPRHNYYERGNLDVFSGLGECLDTPICGLNLISDGSGPHHGWYCNYIEVTSTGPHIDCNQHLFEVEQWLASDAYPYSLNAARDDCILQPVSRTRHGAHGEAS